MATVAGWQRQWSDAASQAKRSIVLWRTVSLALAVGGAALVTLAAQVAELDSSAGTVLAVAGAIAVGLVPVLGARLLSRERVRGYTRMRAVSEALKSELYRFLTKTGDYAGDDAAGKLLELAEGARASGGGLLAPRPAAGARAPEVTDVASYARERVDGQIAYYGDRARTYDARVSRLRAAELAVAAGAVVLAAVAAAVDLEGAAAWVPVLTTVGAALLAHLAAAHYAEDALAYSRTAERLEHLRARRAAGTIDGGDFVTACEDAIAAENKAWMATWSADEARSS